MLPLLTATLITIVVYEQDFVRLLLKVNEVSAGVFDTSVPAYPIVGIFFLLIFIMARKEEMLRIILDRRRNAAVTAAGLIIASAPLVATALFSQSITESYAFGGVALVAS